MTGGLARVVVRVDGAVQGVGFRWWVSEHATRLGLSGRAENRWDGSVEVDAQGPPEGVDEMVRLLTDQRVPGRPGRVASYLVERRPPDPGVSSFTTR